MSVCLTMYSFIGGEKSSCLECTTECSFITKIQKEHISFNFCFCFQVSVVQWGPGPNLAWPMTWAAQWGPEALRDPEQVVKIMPRNLSLRFIHL